jgi:hypothetical protein
MAQVPSYLKAKGRGRGKASNFNNKENTNNSFVPGNSACWFYFQSINKISFSTPIKDGSCYDIELSVCLFELFRQDKY